MARVSVGREDWIAQARAIAIEVAEANGTVTINDAPGAHRASRRIPAERMGGRF